MAGRCLLATVAAIILAAIFGAVPTVSAPAYPAHPVTMVVPFNAGGVTDILARILAERMKLSLGQPVIVENVAGASGAIGVGKVARAAPDGYTLSIGDRTSHVVTSALVPVPYDVLRDFQPVAPLTTSPLWIVAKAGIPAGSLKELIAWLRSNPDHASAAIAGIGSAGHLGAIEFQNRTGTRFQLIPYRSGAPAVQGLIAGQIDFAIIEASQTLSCVRAGQIKAFAVMAKDRWVAAPEIPTTDEAGAPGLYLSLWRGLWVPNGTPQNIVDKLNSAVVDALADPLVQRRLGDLGQEIPPIGLQTPETLRALHKTEVETWWPIVKAAGLKAE